MSYNVCIKYKSVAIYALRTEVKEKNSKITGTPKYH